MKREKINLNGKEYFKEKYLGKGKSGYSYLISDEENKNYVLKEIHEEPCAYYDFQNDKVEAEINAYKNLKKLNIKMPELIEWNIEKRYLIKEFIDGKTVAEKVAEGKLSEDVFERIFGILDVVYVNKWNLDYFPNNFVVKDNELYYIDYEYNEYSDEWNFENWGIYYWLNTKGMKHYLETGDHSKINISADSGKSISAPFEEEVKILIKKYKNINR